MGAPRLPCGGCGRWHSQNYKYRIIARRTKSIHPLLQTAHTIPVLRFKLVTKKKKNRSYAYKNATHRQWRSEWRAESSFQPGWRWLPCSTLWCRGLFPGSRRLQLPWRAPRARESAPCTQDTFKEGNAQRTKKAIHGYTQAWKPIHGVSRQAGYETLMSRLVSVITHSNRTAYMGL